MKTLLNGVNEVLKKAQIVTSDNELSSLTSSGKQVFIDQAVQAWNEAIDQLYSTANMAKPNQMEEESITLVNGTRAYAMEDDLVRLHWPLHDETNGWFIVEYPGGYEQLRKDQAYPSNYPGLPQYGAIRPSDGYLYFDRIPQSDEAGRVFKYIYSKELELTSKSSQMPFNDTVFRAMVPVVHELWRLYQENKYSEGVADISYGRAARLLTQQPLKDSWISRGRRRGFDPYEGD